MRSPLFVNLNLNIAFQSKIANCVVINQFMHQTKQLPVRLIVRKPKICLIDALR
jgi:hypothetical protein